MRRKHLPPLKAMSRTRIFPRKTCLLRLRPWHSTPWHEKPRKCKLSVGDATLDAKLVHLDGSDTSVHKVVEEGDTLAVMEFGSITCPPFRRQHVFERNRRDCGGTKGQSQACCCVLAEAHPKDGWHLGVNDDRHMRR